MIFVPFDVPSSKNSKVKTSKGVFNSPAVREYLQKIGVKKYSSKKQTVEDYKTRPNLFREAVGEYFLDIEYPQILGFHLVRRTRGKFDFHNLIQLPLDLLTAHGFIEDDNMDCIVPMPMKLQWLGYWGWYTWDKNNPGVWIKRLDDKTMPG